MFRCDTLFYVNIYCNARRNLRYNRTHYLARRTQLLIAMKKLYLWVWESVLEDYTVGVAFAFAADEAGAWDALKKCDDTAWWSIRGSPEDRDDPRTPEQLGNTCPRPRKVTKPEGFACWGGG